MYKLDLRDLLHALAIGRSSAQRAALAELLEANAEHPEALGGWVAAIFTHAVDHCTCDVGESPMARARRWAGTASRDELKATIAAALSELDDDARRAFLQWAAKP